MPNIKFGLRLLSVLVLLQLGLFIFISSVNAATITILSFPQTITSDPFDVQVSVGNVATAKNYLRIDLYKAGTTDYFGETLSPLGWYGGSDYSQYLPISVVSGSTWSGEVQGRVGNPSFNDYPGSGNYKMRIRRYTESGSSNAGDANLSAVDVVIDLSATSSPSPSVVPTSIPTETPISTPTLSSTPTPQTPIDPSSTPTSTPSETPIPTATTVPTPVVTATPSTTPTLTPVPTHRPGDNKNDHHDWFGLRHKIMRCVVEYREHRFFGRLVRVPYFRFFWQWD